MNERYEHIINHNIDLLKAKDESNKAFKTALDDLNEVGFDINIATLFTQENMTHNLAAIAVTLMDISATLALICDKMADSKNYG